MSSRRSRVYVKGKLGMIDGKSVSANRVSAMGFETMRTCVQWILSPPPQPLGQTDICSADASNLTCSYIVPDTPRLCKLVPDPREDLKCRSPNLGP